MPLELTTTETPPVVPREMWNEGAVSVSGAAGILDCSRKFVFEMMKDGRLPWGRLGRARRIPRKALVDLLAGTIGSNNAA